MLYLVNAFSINMLAREGHDLVFRPISAQGARNLLRADFINAVGHEQLAPILTQVLRRRIDANRLTVELARNDSLLVAQYRGPRLPEGAAALPEGANLEFWQVYHDAGQVNKVSVVQEAETMQNVVGLKLDRIG